MGALGPYIADDSFQRKKILFIQDFTQDISELWTDDITSYILLYRECSTLILIYSNVFVAQLCNLI